MTKSHQPNPPSPDANAVEAAVDAVETISPEAAEVSQDIASENPEPETAPEAPTAAQIEALQAQLQAAEEKAAQNWDVALRTKAEMENLKRRAALDMEKAHKFALEKIAQELLTVRDSMELGLAASSQAGEKSAELSKLHEGNELTLKMLITLMEKFNIVQLAAKGAAFNPEHHQAIATRADANLADNTVAEVVQNGYLLNERLLRPAMVIVVKN